MKRTLRKLFLGVLASVSVFTANAQQVADFENLTLAPNSYWNGSKTLIKNDTMYIDTVFTSGDAIFPNRFSREYPKYHYWKEGWAYSNIKDDTTNGSLYNAYAKSGYNSDNYVIGQNNAVIHLNANAKGHKVKGVYITNSTYAGLTIKNGYFVARKFGDTTGTNTSPKYPQGGYPDWFKLTIKGYRNGALTPKAVEVYLADYRFDDNSKDYILKTWQWVGLDSLGGVDSVLFTLTSSDVGSFGMNTPAFFCIDNFTTESPTGIAKMNIGEVKLYPNPASDNFTIDLGAENANSASTIDIYDLSGKLIETHVENSQRINLSVAEYQAGVYFVSIKNSNGVINTRFIRE